MLRIMTLLMIGLLTFSMSITNALTLADKGGGGHGGGHNGGHGNGHKANHGNHGNHGNKGGASGHAKANHAARFSTANRTTINNYLRQNPFPAESLPPGIAMNLARGKPLPPGIAKRSLPPALVEQLPAHPGYDYIAVGKDVVLEDSTTGTVADILSNVLH